MLEINTMTKRQNDYSKKLQDPRWQRKRLEVMQAAGWKCVICGDKDEELNVHHPAYQPHHEPWEYSNLHCVCKTCHTIYHLPKEKLIIHARHLITERIFVTHEQQFLSGLNNLIISVAKYGRKYVEQLHKIRLEAIKDYQSLEANTADRVDEFLGKFHEETDVDELP